MKIKRIHEKEFAQGDLFSIKTLSVYHFIAGYRCTWMEIYIS